MFYIFNIYSSILIFIIALVFTLRSKTENKSLAQVAALLAFIFISMSNIFIVSNYFTGFGLNEAVLYHLRLDTAEAGVGEYNNIIIASAFMVLLSLVLTYKISRKKVATIPVLFLYLLAIFTSPLTHNLYTLFKPNEFQGIKADINKAGDEIAEIKNKKNIIIIYAEGFERTYLNNDVFPNMTPNMRELEKESLSFTNMYSNYGATWTIGGMVTSQCGIPLVTAGEGNSMEGIYSFYPSAVCLPDILHSNGYIGAHLKGASVIFSGTKNYLKTHKYSLIKGKDELKKKYPTARTNSWGFYDKNLFQEAKIIADNLAKKDHPFFLSMNTLDTHHPKGHVFPSCKINHKEGDNRLVKAFKCSDYYIKEFVDKIRASEYSKDTIIVILSDHLSMRNLLSDKLKGMNRKNLFLMNFHDNNKKGEIKKEGTHLDVATTILAQLGTDYKVGLGVNLFTEDQTLYGKYQAKTDSYLKGMNDEFIKLWATKSNHKGIRIEDEFLFVGDNKFEMPLMLYYDKKGQVTPTFFKGKYQVRYPRTLMQKAPDQAFTWIDYCDLFASYFQTNTPNNKMCVISGKMGGNLKIEPLSENFHLSNNDISKITNSKINYNNYTNYRKLLTWSLNGPLKSLVESTREGDIIQYKQLPNNFEAAFNRTNIGPRNLPSQFYRYVVEQKLKDKAKINGKSYRTTLVKNDTGFIKKIHNILKKILYSVTGRDYYPTVTGVQRLELITN